MTSDELDPQEEAVRRLLADAGKDPERVPPQVASRLEGVLADLSAERAAATPPGGAPVPSLDERRRRRWPQVLVAAAAVSVIAVGAGNLLTDGTSEFSSAGDAGGAAVESAPEAPGAGEGNREPDAGSQDLAPHADAAIAEPRLRTESLRTDIQRIEDFELAPRVARPREMTMPSGACDSPQVNRGDSVLRVLLDREPSVLVLRKPVDGERVAEVFGCDDAESPVATTTVRTR